MNEQWRAFVLAQWGKDDAEAQLVLTACKAAYTAGLERAAILCDTLPTTDVSTFARGSGNIAVLAAKLCAQRIRDAVPAAAQVDVEHKGG